jgi:hypothetical protein
MKDRSQIHQDLTGFMSGRTETSKVFLQMHLSKMTSPPGSTDELERRMRRKVSRITGGALALSELPAARRFPAFRSCVGRLPVGDNHTGPACANRGGTETALNDPMEGAAVSSASNTVLHYFHFAGEASIRCMRISPSLSEGVTASSKRARRMMTIV